MFCKHTKEDAEDMLVALLCMLWPIVLPIAFIAQVFGMLFDAVKAYQRGLKEKS